MKKKLVKRWIAIEESKTDMKLFLSGRDMYPRFFKAKKEALNAFFPTYVTSILIPPEYAEGNDE